MHVELVKGMSTLAFVLPLIRFTNVYDNPSHICSNNARSFVGEHDFLKEVFTSDEFTAKFQSYYIKHITIPLYST